MLAKTRMDSSPFTVFSKLQEHIEQEWFHGTGLKERPKIWQWLNLIIVQCMWLSIGFFCCLLSAHTWRYSWLNPRFMHRDYSQWCLEDLSKWGTVGYPTHCTISLALSDIYDKDKRSFLPLSSKERARFFNSCSHQR